MVSNRAPARFAIEVRTSGDDTRVTLAGEFDLAARAGLGSALCGLLGPRRRVTVDLTDVTLLDAGAVGLLLQLQQRARALGGDLTFVHAHGIVARVLAILGVEEILGGATT